MYIAEMMICQSLTIKVVSVTMIGKSEKMKMKKKQHLPTENAQILPHLSTLIQNNFK